MVPPISSRIWSRRTPQALFWAALLSGVPLLLAIYVLGLATWDLAVPLIYTNADDIWQLTLTKVLHDTGWVLTNPYLGAPGVASWHHNAAAQTSALHSILMLALSPFSQDPIRSQQLYYLLNFPLICATSFVACRLLGVARLPAFCVGMLFAFTTFRINAMFYSFLANYFMVPLALVPVVWILSGRFAAAPAAVAPSAGRSSHLLPVLRSREFLLGLVFVALTAASDGYYAFFTLLLLGFAAFARAMAGDWRRPAALLPPVVFIVALLAVSLTLMIPLQLHKKAHWEEFHPNGIEDSTLVKHPFEAEVYSSSLKLMVSPIPNHRVAPLGEFGAWMVETSDQARRYKNGSAIVPLGTLGTLSFGAALVLLLVPTLRNKATGASAAGSLPPPGQSVAPSAVGDALLSLVLFIFLCSIVGGIGTLVALVFPTIRAYDRFPLFLIFVLYLGAGWLVTQKLRSARAMGRGGLLAVTVLVTIAALYDQIPRDARKGDDSSKARFLAERRFVQELEAGLPPGSMIYQYPYSQYLRDSEHYGWGSFSHVRLYLHSRELRWSNGGAKNSPQDDWNQRISHLPFESLVTEIEAVGFAGLVIDRTVLAPEEYERLRAVLAELRYEIDEDEPSGLAFVRLRDPGFRLIYDRSYREVDAILVTDPGRLPSGRFPRLVNGNALTRHVAAQPDKVGFEIRKTDHAEIIVDGSVFTRGLGQAPILPLSDMHGSLVCSLERNSMAGGGYEQVVLTLGNHSAFDWKLGGGPFPIGIGVHIRRPDGELLRWDDGYRLPLDVYMGRGASHTVRLPLNALPLSRKDWEEGPFVVEFALVQDGHAWFGDVSCRVPMQ